LCNFYPVSVFTVFLVASVFHGFSFVESLLLDELGGGLAQLAEGGPGQVLHPLGQLELGRGGVGVEQVGEQSSELFVALVLEKKKKFRQKVLIIARPKFGPIQGFATSLSVFVGTFEPV
jgi:hypothetical protein